MWRPSLSFPVLYWLPGWVCWKSVLWTASWIFVPGCCLKLSWKKKKSAARACGIGCASSRFQGRSSRNTPLQQCDSNERSRLGRGASRDDPKNGCKGDNILTVAFFNIEDITWSQGDTNFVQRVLKNIPRVSTSNQWIPVQSISSHFWASSSVRDFCFSNKTGACNAVLFWTCFSFTVFDAHSNKGWWGVKALEIPVI